MMRSGKTPGDDPLGTICTTFVYKATVCNIRSGTASAKMQLPLAQGSADPKNYRSGPLVISVQSSRCYISRLERRGMGVNEL